MYKYLTYIINPYTLSGKSFFKLEENGAIRDITLKQLSDEPSTIVTYDFWILVPYFRNLKVSLPKSIVDVSQVARLLTGKSHLEYKESSPWSVWKLLDAIDHDKEDFYAVKRWFFKGYPGLEKYEPNALLAKFSNGIKILWEKQLANLEAAGEYSRYFDIEKPINEILINSQYKGIKINEKILLEKLDYIDKATYNASKELKSKWHIASIYDKENIAKKLSETGFKYISKNINNKIFYILVPNILFLYYKNSKVFAYRQFSFLAEYAKYNIVLL